MKLIAHLLFNSGRIKKEIKMFAKTIHNKKILEIGSGNNPADKYFDNTNDFTKSDIGTIDATEMDLNKEYDLIVCINVLDDIFEYQIAVDNMYKALKEQGKIFLIITAFYPIHDIPHDYFRFTEYSLKRIFSRFDNIKIKTIGLKRFPSYYILEAEKEK